MHHMQIYARALYSACAPRVYFANFANGKTILIYAPTYMKKMFFFYY